MTNTRDKVIEKLLIKEGLEDEDHEFDGSLLTVGNREYLILNREDREKEVRNYICDTIEYFNPDFLSRLTGIEEEAFKGISEHRGANKLVTAIINGTCGMDKLVEEAVDSDGYGHFLSPYSGEEIELPINMDWDFEIFYAYRVN